MNLPNKLTLFRVILIPVFLVLLYLGFDIPALVVFVVASLTDLLDGKIARSKNLVTNFGKFADTSGKVFDAAGKGVGLVNALRGESNKVQRIDNKVKDNVANDLADVMKRASNIINDNDKSNKKKDKKK